MRKLLIGIGVIGLCSIAFRQVGISNNSPAATTPPLKRQMERLQKV